MLQQLNADVPEGFFELLVDFTTAVLTDKPEEFLIYAAKYFQTTYNEQEGNKVYESKNVEKSDSFVESLLDSLDVIDEDDMEVKPKANYRRKSVAAERIEMDDFDDDEDMYTINPKTDEQRLRLKNVCKQILLFQSLDDDQIGHIIDAMFIIESVPGDKIIVQGDEGDNFYIIESGIFNCYLHDGTQDKLIHTYKNEGFFGELALMYNAQRSATVVSDTPGVLWAMDRKTFRNLVVVQTFNRKQIYDNFLKEFPIFQEMTASERMNIADALVPKKFEDAEIIIKQGKPGQEMFFIESGEVLITKKVDGKEMELIRLHKGQYFGELALLSNQARQASAQAVGETKCAMLDVKTFERLMGPCLEIMKRNTEHYHSQVGDLFKTDIN